MRAAEIVPIVRRKLKEGRIVVRAGRGFSLNELRAAGVTIDAVKRLGIPVDKRRRSMREENVRALRERLREVSEAGLEA